MRLFPVEKCDVFRWTWRQGEGNSVDLLACLLLSFLATKLERTFCKGLRPRPAEILEARMNTTIAAAPQLRRRQPAVTVATSNEMIVVC